MKVLNSISLWAAWHKCSDSYIVDHGFYKAEINFCVSKEEIKIIQLINKDLNTSLGDSRSILLTCSKGN
jgi:hypothetical protein